MRILDDTQSQPGAPPLDSGRAISARQVQLELELELEPEAKEWLWCSRFHSWNVLSDRQQAHLSPHPEDHPLPFLLPRRQQCLPQP